MTCQRVKNRRGEDNATDNLHLLEALTYAVIISLDLVASERKFVTRAITRGGLFATKLLGSCRIVSVTAGITSTKRVHGMNETKRKSIRITASVLLLMGLLITGCVSVRSVPDSNGISIKIDDVYESGEKVQLIIQMEQPLTERDRLVVAVGESRAAEFRTVGGFTTALIGLRLRMLQTDTVRVTVLRNDGKRVEITKSVTIMQPGIVPAMSNNSLKKRVRVDDRQVFVMLDNNMAKDGFVKQVAITHAGSGVVIETSSHLPAFPFFSIQWDVPVAPSQLSVGLSR